MAKWPHSQHGMTEYDPKEVRIALDEATCKIDGYRFRNRQRVGKVVLREAAQDHERKAKECRKALNGYFSGEMEAPGLGGECVSITAPESASPLAENAEHAEAVADGDALSRTASKFRLEALANADAFALGIDMAESVGASNSLEKALAHEIAVAHALSLRFSSKATMMLTQVQDWIPVPKRQSQTADAARLGGSAAKLMMAASKGAEALHKLRGGSPQRIVVQHIHQHVHVADGGQAVIAGNTDSGGGVAENDK